MLSLMLLAWLSSAQAPLALPIDARRIECGAIVLSTEIDTRTLKGEVRRLAWSPEGTVLYLQTAEGRFPETLHHYSIARDGGTVSPLDREPAWATTYWAVKQDLVAPGLRSLAIQVVDGASLIRGSGNIANLGASAGAGNLAGIAATGAENVVRLTLLGEEIAMWSNERPDPGARFSWGPSGSGALVYVSDKGRLVFFDRDKRRQAIPSTKDALLPAWSTDGKRLAWLQKTGRKKYALNWAPVAW